MPVIKTPAELANDEIFRVELRSALEHPAIQTALSSLRFHHGLFRTPKAASPAAVVYHAATWVAGFNSALDSLQSMTEKPDHIHRDLEPYAHIQPDPDL